MSRRDKRAPKKDNEERPAVVIRFGGWYDGDNHKPGRGWYFVCRCGHVGLGQLLPLSAVHQWKKHVNRCDAVNVEEAA